jgi:hypothetical protein
MATRLPGSDKPEKEEQSDDTLKQRIAELEAELAASKTSEQKAIELAAHNAAAAQSVLLFNSTTTEIHMGKTEDGKDLWKYKIDLPPSGGTDIKVNMVPYYHGETYTFETDLLRTIKEIVQRSWGHEASIQGSNENFYRKEMNRTISGRGGR